MTEISWLFLGAFALLTALNSFAIIALTRQIGLLLVRIGPSGARYASQGPDIGVALPHQEFRDLDGNVRSIGGVSDRPTLLAFVSPTCGSCDQVARDLAALVKSEHNLSVVALSIRHDEEANRAAAEHWWGSQVPLVLSPEMAKGLRVHSTPFAIILDNEGVVRAKGIVNQIEHLYSLLNALESGYATADEFVLAQRDGKLGPVPAEASMGERGRR